jgi:hypothetical protein
MATHLLINFRQLKCNWFAADDSILGSLPETRNAAAFPLGIEAFQRGHLFAQPLPDRIRGA